MTRNKLTELIKRHQVVAFFVLTFAISWGLWIPIFAACIQRQDTFVGTLLIFGAYTPALVGIAITRIIDTD